MTHFIGSVVLFVFTLAIALWVGVGAEVVTPPGGRRDEGLALQLFFNRTSAIDFDPDNPCKDVRFVNCTDLRVTMLNVTGKKLNGSIPNGTIANLTRLEFLDLSNNSIVGLVPDLSHLSSLSVVRLGGNSFTDFPNSFPPSLTELDLSYNNLSGRIPPWLFNNLLNLSSVKLANNRLSGNISFTANAVALKTLDLSFNSFSSFPSDFRRFDNLTVLTLADNKFLSQPFPDLPAGSLQKLQLSNTNLSGNIPHWIGNLTNLVSLNLSGNNLNGSIPTEMGALIHLELLDLSTNNLAGEIPDVLKNLNFLGTFNVSANKLSGPIPKGQQFNTFLNTSFLGNPGLCGFPLPACPPSSAPSPISAQSISSGKGSSVNVVAIIAGVVSGIVFVGIVGGALFIWCRVSRAVKPLAKDEPKHVSGPMQFEKDAETWASGVKDSCGIMVVMFEKPLLNLSFADLLQVTGNFSKEMQIADGGYGPVYKGVLPDTTQLAIKVLVDVGFPDNKRAAAKIESLAKVKHSNLVPLVGYCLVGEDSVLIYEYMVNGDLQRWLHELPEGIRNPEDWSRDTWEHLEGAEVSGEYLSWPTRHKIALGTARGLAFLHHGCYPQIVHRDVKASNILLDDNFEPHLVDSGLAGIARTSGTPIIGGTLGYVPPEYGQTWEATTRGDVYSFGVVLLELVTGREPTGHYFHDSYGGNLVGWVRSMMRQDKRGLKALDPKLVSRGHVVEMLETLRIGYLCTAETPAKRPSMQQVVGLLKDCQAGGMT